MGVGGSEIDQVGLGGADFTILSRIEPRDSNIPELRNSLNHIRDPTII